MINNEIIRLISKFPRKSVECRNCDKPINNDGYFCSFECANENLIRGCIRGIVEKNKEKTFQDIIYLVNDIINQIDTKKYRYAYIHLRHIVNFYVNKMAEEDIKWE